MATILLVDDEHLIRRAVGRLLSRSHVVLLAESGEAALIILKAHPNVDVILTDLMMPGIGGKGLYAQLPDHLRSRTILMTGALGMGPLQQFVESVSAPLILKPFFLHELLEAIGSILNAHDESPL